MTLNEICRRGGTRKLISLDDLARLAATPVIGDSLSLLVVTALWVISGGKELHLPNASQIIWGACN